jgi:hypothetical protein
LYGWEEEQTYIHIKSDVLQVKNLFFAV